MDGAFWKGPVYVRFCQKIILSFKAYDVSMLSTFQAFKTSVIMFEL